MNACLLKLVTGQGSDEDSIIPVTDPPPRAKAHQWDDINAVGQWVVVK
jgi:hypothetical protein